MIWDSPRAAVESTQNYVELTRLRRTSRFYIFQEIPVTNFHQMSVLVVSTRPALAVNVTCLFLGIFLNQLHKLHSPHGLPASKGCWPCL